MLPQPGSSRLTSNPHKGPGIFAPRFFSRSLLRRRRFYAVLAFFLFALYYFRVLDFSLEPIPGYEATFNEEMQHALEMSNREEATKYLHFRVAPYTRVDEALANLFLHAHLAHASGRTYVFDPLEPVSSTGSSAWSRKKVLPLSSVLNVGETWDVKAISRPLSSIGWHHVCPKRQRKLLRVSPEDLARVYDPSALMNKWIDKIKQLDASCVEIVGELFTDSVLDSKMIQGLYDMVSSSPILKQYTFKPNIHTIASNILPAANHSTLSPTSNNTIVVQAYLPPSSRLDDPCSVLSSRSAPFRTFAHLKGLPTSFEFPATQTYYTQRCNPTIQQIVGRIGVARNISPALKHVYIVDGPLGLSPTQWTERKRWFEELRFELTTKHGWESARWASAGAKPESVAIDTELAVRAHAYTGNGFSDFSSNVVLLRLARGAPKGSLRFL